MIKHSRGTRIPWNVTLPPPPPQHKCAPKTSDISKEYPDYLNGNLHMKTTDARTKTTRPGVRSHRIIQYRLYLAEHTNVTKYSPDAGLAVGRVKLHRVHRGPPKTQSLHVNRRSACSRALGRGCYFRFWVWVTSDCLLKYFRGRPMQC